MVNPATSIDREAALQQIRESLRIGQQHLADWQAGSLAVSAVPGSGKSTGMAAAAAIAIARHQLHARKQLVLVTFTRSAAANLKAKVRAYLRQLALPQNSFVVYTLHGLALTIATRNPELSGLNLEALTLVSPNQSHRLVRACVEQWIATHPKLYARLIEGRQFDGEETERLRRQSTLRTEVLPELAHTAIREAKSSGLTPADLAELAETLFQGIPEGVEDYQVLAIAAGLYDRYQDLMQRRGWIDYDDMILAALKVLEDEPSQHFWQTRVFAIFEDEAQDSSPLQTKLLETLAVNPEQPTHPPNLLRVGDPNQAINSTFTPADPVFFNQFCNDCRRQDRLITINQAGRSTPLIMDAANLTLTWVNQSDLTGDERPFRLQAIAPVAADDPQPDANPAPLGKGVELHTPTDINHTVELIAQRVLALFRQDPQLSLAILVRENRQGRFLAERLRNPEPLGVELEQAGVRIYEVGERDRQSHIPTEMLTLLQFIERPHSPDALKSALRVFVNRQCIPTQDLNVLSSLPEQFLYPGPLDNVPETDAARQARRYCASLLRARLELPPYQLIPFLGLTLVYNQSELATADKLAARVAQQTAENNTLATMIEALQEIVGSERFEAVETEDASLLYTRPGQLTVITMHKAKGLDWDAVFLPFLHEQLIPGRVWIPPQMEFLGDFTLSGVARAQIRAHTHAAQKAAPMPDIWTAWRQSGYLKKAEEFRLLYVAMTRAKRLLWMSAAEKAPFSWSKPENLQTAAPCPVIKLLSGFS